MAYYTTIDMIKKLVSFNTESANSNLELIQFVAEYLGSLGVGSEIIYSEDGEKANLLAMIGPEVAGGVVLSGHTDVVPVAGQAWHTDPYTVVCRDERLYGRGTADMKSFCAIALALVPEMLQSDLKRPIYLAFSYDEEIGCLGAPAMVDVIADELPDISAVIVGEPTEMKLATSHKGCAVFETSVTGHEAHSSQPHLGASAIMGAAQIINYIGGLHLQNQANPVENSIMVPPYTSLHVGTVTGGTADNIIAGHCQFEWDIRLMPGAQAEDYSSRVEQFGRAEVLPAMQAVSEDCRIDTNMIGYIPPLQAEFEGAAESMCQHILGQEGSIPVAFATEAGIFQQSGFSTVICGPGSIAQAHKPNEYIELSEVQAAEDFMRRIIAIQAS